MRRRRFLGFVLTGPGWLHSGAAEAAAASDLLTVQFKETDTVFQNPGKGWMTGPKAASDPRFPASVAYFRLNWGDIEPREGQFNWSLFDDVIAACQPRGMRVAFRIMATNAHSTGYYCSPKWLFDAGCRSFEYLRGGDDPTSGGIRITRIEPDYSDSLYLEKHGDFLRALGKRYDGHPRVEFLDIGSYGIWGEWHTSHPASVEVRRKIVDMYLQAFERTPLVSMTDDAEALAYAIARGAGFRRDGVGEPWDAQVWNQSDKYKNVAGLASAWERAPVVFEWFGNYEYLKSRKWSFDRAIQFMLDNHVTFINDNIGAVPPEETSKLAKLARLSGYRFVLRELAYARRARRGERLRLAMSWSNVGVGRLYREFPLELYLLDSEGGVAVRSRAFADARSWLPGDHKCVEELIVPQRLRPGEYGLGLALVDKEGRPAIKLAIEAPETGRLYHLGHISIE
jgi:hypothetical protein